MESKAVSCCFTGHRLILPEHKQKLFSELVATIEHLYENGYRIFWSGGAVGFDLIGAEAVIELRKKYSDMKLFMALPCKNQHKSWSRVEKCRYEKILNAADKTIFLCETYCTGCMHLRNKYLVDNSQVCIAYYNYTSGGTAHTVGYAREKELELINLAQKL